MDREFEFSGVSMRFGTSRALDSVTWEGGGQVVGVLGPNGAGKSTLLQLLGTVLVPDEGGVRIFGLDPTNFTQRLAIRRQLGYLPQTAGLHPGFSAFDLVDYVAVLKEVNDRDLRRTEVRRVLIAVGLEADMHRRIRKLSGGMKRRVALAASILGRPRLLVLDEPSAGLDPDQRLRLESIVHLARAHATVVMSTHHAEEVAALCQQVLVLDRGQVRFDGTPTALAATATGRVWLDDGADPRALRSRRSSHGEVRNIGTPPPGAQLVEPTIEDAYLLVTSEPRVSA